MALLEVQGLEKYYGRRKVVDGVTFHVNEGEVVGLLGPNGAGKTTSFRMTTGMVPPHAGKVVFAGEDVTHWPMYKRARLGMGYLSQESSIFRKLTVEQNILAILEAMPMCRVLRRRLSRRERWQRTEEVLDQFGLSRFRKNWAVTLSGGEKRRLEIARCLVTKPLLILLDEPFTGIDPITIGDIQNIVRRLRGDGIGLLLTDHNVREALKITDRSYLIKDGTVKVEGTPKEIINHPVAINDYLGQSFADDGFGPPPSPRLPVPSAAAETPVEAAAALPLAPTATLPLERPTLAVNTVQSVLEQERIYLLIENLKRDPEAAEQELLQVGRPAIPKLIEALERRDLDMRRLAFQVLQRVLDGAGHFDAYAPEVQRRQQIAQLRERFLLRAG
jgi:lipopolysaccharide export system ATP-binding protein